MNRIYHIASCLLLSLLFFLEEGCTHKDLNEDAHTTIAEHVDVVFDWSKSPTKKASNIILYLYSDDREMMDFRFNNPDGGMIRSYGGPHTAVCHSNDDPYGIKLRNEHSHDEIELYTDNTALLVGQKISTQGIPRAKGTEDEPLRSTPPMVYGTHDRDVNLKISSFPQTVTFYPEELVCHYTVEFVNVENLKSASLRVDATISSLAGGYYPGRMTANSEVVSHTFTLDPDIEDKSLRSEFLTFGVPAGEPRPHMICLYIATSEGSGSAFTFDVSDKVNNAPDPRNVNIKIYGLVLPDIPDNPPQLPDGEEGFTIEVDTWDTYYFDLSV